MAPLLGSCEAASHMAQPGALTTRIYDYVPGGGVLWGEEGKKKRRRLATDVSSGTNIFFKIAL